MAGRIMEGLPGGVRPGSASVSPVADEPEELPPSSIITAAGVGWLSSRPRLLVATRLAEVAAGLALSLLTLDPGTSGFTPGLWGMVVATLSWLVWIVAREHRTAATVALVAMAAAGGVMMASRAAGLIFVGVSASGAAFVCDLPIAIVLAGPSLVTFVIATGVEGSFPHHLFQFITVALLGLVGGIGRRQLLLHGRQVTLLATVEQRAAVARQEAELLAERNRLGREMHDVLAHTLGAVSIQLTALDSRVAAGDGTSDVRGRIAAIHRLVGDGLGEARDAVRALREDGLSLDEQLGRLCELHGAVLDVTGRRAPIGPQASLALYRAVQEALTNREKHAPQARVTVQLRYGPDTMDVRVDNGPSPLRGTGPLASAGGGNGLRGMRERLQLVGGSLRAGPVGGGWRVHATVPRSAERSSSGDT